MRAIDATPDITLAELRERLDHRARRDLRAQYDPRLLPPPPDHVQKKTAHASEQAREDVSRTPRGLVRSPARARPGEARLHRRDRGHHQDGSAARAQPPRASRCSRRGLAAWPLEDLTSAGRRACGLVAAITGTHDRRRGDEPAHAFTTSLCRDLVARTHALAPGDIVIAGHSLPATQGSARARAAIAARRRQPHSSFRHTPPYFHYPIRWQVLRRQASRRSLRQGRRHGRWMTLRQRPSRLRPFDAFSFPSESQTRISHNSGSSSQIDPRPSLG